MKKKILAGSLVITMLLLLLPLSAFYDMASAGNDKAVSYADTHGCELNSEFKEKAFLAAARIKGISVWRQSSTTASVRFFADTSGTCYYVITDSPNAPADIVSVGTVGATVLGNSTVNINLSGLTSGAKYAHIILKTESGFVSNVLSVAMPYDLYFFDDFESYAINTYPSAFTLRYNGSGDANQKIIVDTMGSNVDNRCFRLQALYSWASEQKVDLPAGLEGVIVMELDAKGVAGVWPLSMEFASNAGTWGTRIARMSMDNGSFGYGTGAGYSVSSGITYNINQWYKIKIVLNLDTRKFDYFADGTKLNTEPVVASNEALNFFSLVAGNTGNDCEGYFDNVKVCLIPYTDISIDTQPAQLTSVNKGSIAGSLSCSATAADGSSLSYRWFSCTDTNKSGAAQVQDATGSDFTIPTGLSEGNYYYFCRIYANEYNYIDTNVATVKVILLHKITATAYQGGTISPPGNVEVTDGEDMTFTITPNTGYHITAVYVDGVNVGQSSSYTFENVYDHKCIEAYFEQHSYTQWVSNNNGTHTGTCSCGDKKTENCTASEWIIDSPATFRVSGTKHKECTVCRAVLETAQIPIVVSSGAGEIIFKGDKGLIYFNTADWTVSKLTALFNNPGIAVFKNNIKLGDNDIVTTGCEIRLLDADKVIDRLSVIIKGDVDCNGIVDVTDARTALRVAVELEKVDEIALYAADTLGSDGKVTVEDARHILRVAVKLEIFTAQQY